MRNITEYLKKINYSEEEISNISLNTSTRTQMSQTFKLLSGFMIEIANDAAIEFFDSIRVIFKELYEKGEIKFKELSEEEKSCLGIKKGKIIPFWLKRILPEDKKLIITTDEEVLPKTAGCTIEKFLEEDEIKKELTIKEISENNYRYFYGEEDITFKCGTITIANTIAELEWLTKPTFSKENGFIQNKTVMVFSLEIGTAENSIKQISIITPATLENLKKNFADIEINIFREENFENN